MSTVLVVEDSLAQREMLSNILKQSGMEVIAARDGVEALEQAQTHHPDLVLLDIVLPRMNGYEVCRRLKSEAKMQKPAVVMCSIKQGASDRYWAIKQGADAYIAKPCHPQELIGTLRQLLGRTA